MKTAKSPAYQRNGLYGGAGQCSPPSQNTHTHRERERERERERDNIK